MSTQQEQNTLRIDEDKVESSYHVYEFFDLIFQEIPKKYNLDQAETIRLRSSYFYKLYELRKANDALEANGIVLDYETLKGLSFRVIKTHNRNTWSEKLSHEWFMSKFREKLGIKKREDTSDKLFELNNLSISIDDIKVSKEPLEEDKATAYTKFILEQFGANQIPFELYLVVWSDVALTLLENAENFQPYPDDYKKTLVHKILTRQISTVGKEITDNSLVLQHPPLKINYSFNMSAQTEDDTCSLQLLTDFFGDEAWHKQFPNYTKIEAYEYFCYNEEPPIKIKLNERKYKKKSIEAKSKSEFLLDKNKEDFFKQWESRLYKNEKIFFKEYVKPKILQGISRIKVDNNKENEILVQGIFDTSNFEHHYDSTFSYCRVVESTSMSENYIELKISKDLFGT